MKIERNLKFAKFTYDEEDKSILIETRADTRPEKEVSHNFVHCPECDGDCKGHIETDEEYAKRVADLDYPISGRIHLNKVYSFALLRFVIRIAQRNWFRKLR